MKDLNKLKCKFNIPLNGRLLSFAELSSRSWGYPTHNSDHDIHYLYSVPIDNYAGLVYDHNKVFEYQMNDTSYVGWDIKKFLYLFSRSNSTCLEFLHLCVEPELKELLNLVPKFYNRNTLVNSYIGHTKEYIKRFGINGKTKNILGMYRTSKCAEYFADTLNPIINDIYKPSFMVDFKYLDEYKSTGDISDKEFIQNEYKRISEYTNTLRQNLNINTDSLINCSYDINEWFLQTIRRNK